MHLTRLGRGALIGGLLAIIGGAVLGFPSLLAVGAACLVAVLAGLAVVAEPPQLVVGRLATPPEVPRSAPASIVLRLNSSSLRRPRRLTVIEQVGGRHRIATVPPFGAEGHVIQYPIDTRRRGLIIAGPLEATRTDPFGLVLARRSYGGTCSVQVRPRIHELRRLPSGRQRDLEGPTRERSEGNAAFHQIREYQDGDDLRRIHWRTTARAGTLMVKQMVDTTRPELLILLDNRTVANDEYDFEEAVEVAVSLLHAAIKDGYPTALQFADGSDTSLHDRRGVTQLDLLTDVRLSTHDALDELRSGMIARGRSLAIITGSPSGEDLVTMALVASGFSPAVFVSVVGERSQPLVAPPGMHAIGCATAAEFARNWTGF